MLKRLGFSLVELSIGLVFAGLISGFALQMNQSSGTTDCYVATQTQLSSVQAAMVRYVDKNSRFPAPAQRNVGVDSEAYGREVTQAELTAGTKVTNASGVSYGALPFQALGLSPAYASDCWGNKFTYAVTSELTDSSKFTRITNLYPVSGPATNAIEGNITVKSANDANAVLSTTAAYAIISHGADAVGAVPSNYKGTDAKWCTGNSTLEGKNCTATSNIVIAATALNTGKDAADAVKFDDVVVFHGKNQRAVDGIWNASWGSCNATCGGGFQERACDSPAPKNGGNKCKYDLNTYTHGEVAATSGTDAPDGLEKRRCNNFPCAACGSAIGKNYPFDQTKKPPAPLGGVTYTLCDTSVTGNSASGVTTNSATYDWTCTTTCADGADNLNTCTNGTQYQKACAANRAVQPLCGSADGKTYPYNTQPPAIIPPATTADTLCGPDNTASAINDGGPSGTQYSWTCNNGNAGDAVKTCAATRKAKPACGTDAGKTLGFTKAPTQLCSSGTASAVDDGGTTGTQYKWTCGNGSSVDDQTCAATRAPLPTCGTAFNNDVASSPTGAAACKAGSSSTPTEDSNNNYNWKCTNTYGDPDAVCQAGHTVQGQCGSVTDGCTVGDLIDASKFDGTCGDANTNEQNATWTCKGRHGGGNSDQCSKALGCQACTTPKTPTWGADQGCKVTYPVGAASGSTTAGVNTTPGYNGSNPAKCANNVWYFNGPNPAPCVKYNWVQSGFTGACTPNSGSCGAGTQTQTVTCQGTDGSTPGDSACQYAGTKPATTQGCSVTCNSCTNTTYPWGGGCSGTVTGVASGQSSTISNGVSGYSGSWKLQCYNGTWQDTGTQSCTALAGTCSATVGACTLGSPNTPGDTGCGGTKTWYCSAPGGNTPCSANNAPCAACSLPWGNLASGQSQTVFSASSAANCNTVQGTVTCNNGTPSGNTNYGFTSCNTYNGTWTAGVCAATCGNSSATVAATCNNSNCDPNTKPADTTCNTGSCANSGCTATVCTANCNVTGCWMPSYGTCTGGACGATGSKSVTWYCTGQNGSGSGSCNPAFKPTGSSVSCTMPACATGCTATSIPLKSITPYPNGYFQAAGTWASNGSPLVSISYEATTNGNTITKNIPSGWCTTTCGQLAVHGGCGMWYLNISYRCDNGNWSYVSGYP